MGPRTRFGASRAGDPKLAPRPIQTSIRPSGLPHAHILVEMRRLEPERALSAGSYPPFRLSPMRLVLLISSLAAGGAERVLVTLAGAWAARGHDVTLLTDAAVALDHYDVPAGVRRIALQLQSDSRGPLEKVGRNLLRVVRVRRAVREEAPDCLIAFGDTVNTRALLACLGLDVRVIISERTDPRQHRLPLPWHVLRRVLYPTATCLVVQTQSVAAWAMKHIAPYRVHVIPNPVRPVAIGGKAPELIGCKKSIVAVGRLGPEKGFDLLLNAFSRAALPSVSWQLVILGDGPERAALSRKIEDLSLQDSVLMPGVVRNPEQWMQHAAMYVLSSRFEGFPNALLEAMQCGLPVAAFDCPSGPGEIVRHEQTGLLVPAGDVDALAAAIARLASDADLRRRLGSAAAADVASRFSLQHVGSMWEELLVGVAGQAR
jgi:GalNAc-alpha-(1->4)-GalNAc-alpha-(1->3)-diNAcBac-PP-undecaprenol alpha-1,4-N-acetyl-D-galactosaminyltransferase